MAQVQQFAAVGWAFRGNHAPPAAGCLRRLAPRGGLIAAWFRLNTLMYNLLAALNWLTLPGDLRTRRPRFLLFNTVGRL